MTTQKLFNFYDYLRLGSEQAKGKCSTFKKLFFSIFGFLQINPRIRAGRIIEEITKLDLDSSFNVLEAGFGYGICLFGLARKFPEFDFTGYEIDPRFTSNAQAINAKMTSKNISVVQKNLETMTDKDKFDLIYSCDVLEHIRDDVGVLRNFYTAFKSEGLLLLHLPLKYEEARRIFPWFTNFDTPDHVRDEYLPEEITQKLQEVGFSVLEIKYGYDLLFGELAFELNNFIRSNKYLLTLSQLLSFPLSIILGFIDIKRNSKKGNSMIILAQVRK